MEDKKVLKDKELEKVNGGLGNHEFEFGNTLISGTSVKVSGGTNLSDMPQHDERQGWTSSKLPTDDITAADGPGLYDYFLDIVE